MGSRLGWRTQPHNDDDDVYDDEEDVDDDDNDVHDDDGGDDALNQTMMEKIKKKAMNKS